MAMSNLSHLPLQQHIAPKPLICKFQIKHFLKNHSDLKNNHRMKGGGKQLDMMSSEIHLK